MEDRLDRPVTLELVSAENRERYRVGSRPAILQLLREMTDQRSFVRAFFSDDRSTSFLTAVADVLEQKDAIVLDLPIQPEVNERIGAGASLLLSTTVNRVQVQFTTTVTHRGSFEGFSAAYAKLPHEMMRFQRREYFRLTTPTALPIVCEMPQKDGTPRRFDVYDISIGGAAILDMPIDQPGTVLEGVSLILPDEGVIVADLLIRNVFNVTRNNGSVTRRVGCSFEGLSMPMQNMIQRYILRIERERKARTQMLA